MAQGILIVNFPERFPTDKVFQGENDPVFTRSLETFVSRPLQQTEFEDYDKNTRGKPCDKDSVTEVDVNVEEMDDNVTEREDCARKGSLAVESLEKEGLKRNASAETDISNEIPEHQLTVTSLTEKPLIDFSRSKGQGIKQKLVSFFSRDDEETKKEKRQKRKAEIEALRQRFKPPDGGYGWLVVFGTFLVQLWITGLIKSFGIIFLEVMTVFPNSSASLAAWIPAILTFISLVLSPVTSALCLRFSCRSVVFAGGLCSCLGLTLSSFATSLEHLCFTIGVLVGVGAGLATTPGILMTSRYFEKRRALANGICISGTAVGSMGMPLLVECLTPHYGFRGTILILGACMLHVCIAAVLFRPIEVYQRILEKDAKAKAIVENNEAKPDEKEELDQNVADAIMKSGRFSISLHTQDAGMISPGRKLDDGLPEAKFSLEDSDDEDARSLVHDTITPLVNSRLLRSVRNESTPALRASLPGNSPVVGGQLTRHASLQRDGRYFFGKLGSLKDVTSLRNFDDETLTQNTTPARTRRNVSWLQSTNSLMHSVGDLNVDSTCTYKDQISKSPASEEEKKKKGLQRYVNFGLLKNTLFVLLTSTVMLMAVGCPHVLLYLPAYVTTSMGFTKSESGVLLSITAACDLVGRLLGGWLADMQFISRGKMYSFSMLIAAVTAISIPFANDMVSLGILSGMFGFGAGSWFLMVPILLTDYHGVDIIPSSYGLVRLFQGVVTLGIPPLIGLLRDLTGTYQVGFFIMGGCMSCAAVSMLIFEPLAKKREERKKNPSKEEEEEVAP